MLVSYRWLSEYVDLTGVSPKELGELITRSGIEVETVTPVIADTKGIKVGYVVERQQHPGADKLSVCKVDVGAEDLLQIVCGAKNVGQGQKVAVATVGAVLPGNFKIKRAKLRGELSEGMICSLSELGFEGKVVPKEYAEGIYNFPAETEIGMDALEALNGYDEILELGLTPNRSECLSMLGVAYEVAAILDRELKLPKPEVHPVSTATASQLSVKVEDADACPLYIGAVVQNVKIETSPLWLQNRLMNAGIRPINNVVDITNYILLEYGQPLHAFDGDKLGSEEIVVRRAKEGEKIVTLDDAERTLNEDFLVITNGTEPVAIAGVMGGANSEVSNETTNVIIEAAYFKNTMVRDASKTLGLRSESSVRFEKGIDPYRTAHALQRALQLLEQLAGGEVLTGTVEVRNTLPEARTIEITGARINRALGTSLATEEMASILTRLRFEVEVNADHLTVTVPVRRPDITIEEDIIEEVGRLYGYDNIPVTFPVTESKPGRLTKEQSLRRNVRRYLEGVGLQQAVTYSLTNRERVHEFLWEKEGSTPVELAMPMSEERAVLRQSIVPHLVEAVAYNQNRKIEDVALFEMAQVFEPTTKDTLPNEKPRLAGALSGVYHAHAWQGEKKVVDFFVVKGILEGLFALLGVENRISFTTGALEETHPGRTAFVHLDGEKIGYVGQVHPDVAKKYGCKETYVFELCLQSLYNVENGEIKYVAIPRFPSMTRDVAFVVERNIIAGDIEKTVWEKGGKLLKEVSLFDVYEGDRLEEGKKSLAFSMKYFDPERTLTDEEVTKAHDKIVTAVQEEHGAIVRG